jgi:mannan endo-1,4-beta-mannosidase
MFQMKKIMIALFCLLTGDQLLAQPVAHFYFQGAQMYDPCANPFNMRGVNYAPYNWGYSPNELLLRQIAKTGANTVRMPWYANDPNTAAVYTAAKLQAALDTCTKYGMLPVIELHDQTCSNNPTALISMANYYLRADVKAVLQARQDKLVLNIANEALYVNWTSNAATAQTTFKNTYNTIIANLRNAGYYCPIMVDGPDCGTNSDVLAAVGQELLDNDTQRNLIFSAHAYWYGFANNDPILMQQKMQTMLNTGLPFVLGEIANQQDDQTMCQYTLPYANLLTRCENLGVNWLAWSWYRDGCANRQMTSTGNYANLTPYGNDLVNNTTYGIRAKAVKSPYLMGDVTCSGVVATEKDKSLNLNVKILNNQTNWQFISTNVLPLRMQIYTINGLLLQTHLIAENSSLIIAKPDVQGVYVVQFVDAKGGVSQSKLIH